MIDHLAAHLHQVFAVFAVCMSGLAALAMVLRHLQSMRVTDGEVAGLKADAVAAVTHLRALLEGHEKRLTEIHERLTAVDNRTRR